MELVRKLGNGAYRRPCARGPPVLPQGMSAQIDHFLAPLGGGFLGQRADAGHVGQAGGREVSPATGVADRGHRLLACLKHTAGRDACQTWPSSPSAAVILRPGAVTSRKITFARLASLLDTPAAWAQILRVSYRPGTRLPRRSCSLWSVSPAHAGRASALRLGCERPDLRRRDDPEDGCGPTDAPPGNADLVQARVQRAQTDGAARR